MKYLKIFLPVLVIVLLCSASTPKKSIGKPVYVFGIGASLIDSTIYVTDMQELDSVFLEKKSFLPNRNIYSYQLKNYLEKEDGVNNQTCTVFYSTNKSKLVKQYNKVINKYKKKSGNTIVALSEDNFSFVKPEY